MSRLHKDKLYVIELRSGLNWIKQESIFTSYARAFEVCENLGLKFGQYRIKGYKEKKRKIFEKLFKNLFTF